MLPSHPWKISYSTDTDNPLLDFYIPALERAQRYDRKAGFFNSSILSRVATGLGAILNQDGRIRLILGCQFSPEDVQAIAAGYDLRDRMLGCLDRGLSDPKTLSDLKHFEILSWLIQIGCLDIKIAIPLQPNNQPDCRDPQLDRHHIFHEKVGIITDPDGNQIAFSGSNNESLGGWEGNTESFHVFCSWRSSDNADRIAEETYRFEELWNDIAQNVRSFDLPDAIRQKLLRYAPTSPPTWSPREETDTRPIAIDDLPRDLPSDAIEPIDIDAIDPINPAPININPTPPAPVPNPATPATPTAIGKPPTHPLSYTLETIPITPWPHQLKILYQVADRFPCSFLIADEVGLGKTIETGLILRYLLVSQQVKRVLILAPASVQPQWHSELREKFNLHFWSYSQGEFTYADPNLAAFDPLRSDANPWNQHDRLLASSHLVRRSDRRDELLDAEPWDLVILDEAHHARRKNPKANKDDPNSLLALMRQLKDKTRSLILLSATPMQIHPIEVFDLIALFGLPGRWQYGDLFCEYFATLPTEEPNPHQIEFLQQMSSDYFRHGSICDRFKQDWQHRDRLLYYQLEDTWNRQQHLTNLKQLVRDRPFIAASREYLTTHTPLKDLMFRHTRDTLRQYYKLGLLDRDIPQRNVNDNAIALEPRREVPLYEAVSHYVRDFYRLAQKENRKALGFLMTLYRKRLTSSFYAIQKSLERRLEGISITDDDLIDLDNADDVAIAGLEHYLETIDPKEIEYLEDLLKQFDNTGEDSKLRHFLDVLRRELTERDSAIVFTQYTDTMDYLRDKLRQMYGRQVACYSGRGGELWSDHDQAWNIVPKEQIKRQFRDGELLILLCTESASEGLNLQTCGVLFNYDMPWNPMRVEQRIGRIDRIGQRYPEVRIHNFYYDGTVEAKVYLRLRDRIQLFSNVVGNLQPILASVPTFLERATMSADPLEEDVIMSEFERSFDTAILSTSIDDLAERDVRADLAIVNRKLPPSNHDWQTVERSITQAHASRFSNNGDRTWTLTWQGQRFTVTFDPQTYGDRPSLQLLNLGNPMINIMFMDRGKERDQFD
jgi:superfamily II DNA or RNA helicase